jgi:hypothetical protein
MQFWTGFIRWATGLGPRHSICEMRKAARLWRLEPNGYGDLETRIDIALETLEQLDRGLSEIALVLVAKIDDPRASRARERWKQLTAALAALTTTADELLE